MLFGIQGVAVRHMAAVFPVGVFDADLPQTEARHLAGILQEHGGYAFTDF